MCFTARGKESNESLHKIRFALSGQWGDRPPRAGFSGVHLVLYQGADGQYHPAATLPFGKYSCLGYDGAYPSGAGINCVNSGEKIQKLYDRPKFIGLSHFQQSGTGAIQVYYNYALTSPFYGEFPDFQPRDMEERAEPGYYAARLDDLIAEATVSQWAVLHRYTFAREGGKIAVDFANDGLYADFLRGAASGRVTVLSAHEVLAEMKLSKITLWFDFVCDGTLESLFVDGERVGGNEARLAESEDKFRRMGAIFAIGSTAQVKLAVSAVSAEAARALCRRETRSFDEVRAEADRTWNELLARVEIETDDPREREIFYSNLYHTLVKPGALTDEAFLFADHHGDTVYDIATMWDIYKTQLPLLFTLYPEVSEKFMKTLERFGEEYGYFPHCLLLSGRLDIESKQARMLAEYAIVDAYLRGIPADYGKLLELSLKDAQRFGDYAEGNCEFASHILDMAEAFTALSILAEGLGKAELAARLREQGRKVTSAFDADGIMRADSPYYEGNRYNYSFRPLADMEMRIALAGRERMEEEALRFFGYADPECVDSRFEGFNNETDMEAPYFLHFIGRRDLLCEVVKSGLDSMFTTGRGGIPGNADSGGLTACYLWNALGLFPLSGQDQMILVTPRYRRALLHMPSGDLEIVRVGEGIYTEAAYFNGRKLDAFALSVSDMMRGGQLVIHTR